jgi:putative transposase
MHAARVFRRINAQHRFYSDLRGRFGLAPQPSIRIIGKVADAYAAPRANFAAGDYGPPGSDRCRRVDESPIVFRPLAAQPFDTRCLSWRFPDDAGRTATVSIWTVADRVKNVRIIGEPQHLMLLRNSLIGETDLIRRDGKWFLQATIDRKRQARLRQRLQARKTSSARRLLKMRRRKEARFAADVNHQISKHIVAEAERTGHGIVVEALTGIRDRIRLHKPQRATLHAWAFAQLGSFPAYKAKQSGVAFIEVDPPYTSRTCNACGWVDKRNRRSQAVFECGQCRFVGHADHNAAINIARRGVERRREVMRPHAVPALAAS